MDERIERWKITSLLNAPSVVSTLNVVFGSISVLASLSGWPGLSSRMILLSFIADSIDGFVARRKRKTSEFGKQLDSLADVISFAVAPASLLLVGKMAPALVAYPLAVVMVCCGALRLARFNAMCAEGYSPDEYYLGLPVPWVGTATSCLYFLTADLPSRVWLVVNPVVLAGASALMVSTVRFPSFKRPHPAVITIGGASMLALLFSPLFCPDWLRGKLEVASSGMILGILSYYALSGVIGCVRRW